MPHVLITAGNVFDPTFDGVCYAVMKKLGGVKAIHVFDTAESAEQAEKSQRNSRIRNLLGAVDITTSLIDDNTLQTVIPDRLARLLRNYGIHELIVDLSNGQKITVSVLYAVSTISRIPHIYALEFYTRLTKETRIVDLAYPVDWDYVRIEPLKEILNITQSSYVELVYYRDRIDSIIALLENKNHHFAADAKDRLELALIDYFTISTTDSKNSERLSRCVNGLGKICEDIATIWHHYCHQNEIIRTTAEKFASRTKQIISQWDKYREMAITGKLDLTDHLITNTVFPTFGIDTLLDTMRVYRNFASHSVSYYQFSQHDVRFALDATLLILERIAGSDIFNITVKEEARGE